MSKKSLLVDEISALQARREAISVEIANLTREYESLEIEELNLPKEPGWYFVPRDDLDAGGMMVYLDESGAWDDGWGNGWEYDLTELVGARKVALRE